MFMSRKFLPVFLFLFVMTIQHAARAQESMRVAQIPGINAGPCKPGSEEKPWLNPNQTPGCRALEVIASMTLEEKLAQLVGYTISASLKASSMELTRL